MLNVAVRFLDFAVLLLRVLYFNQTQIKHSEIFMNTPDPQRARPLDHITVVSLEHAIVALFCTRHLADLGGACPVRIERPDVGDFARAYDQRAKGSRPILFGSTGLRKVWPWILKTQKASRGSERRWWPRLMCWFRNFSARCYPANGA
jgi:hypothetical protein